MSELVFEVPQEIFDKLKGMKNLDCLTSTKIWEGDIQIIDMCFPKLKNRTERIHALIKAYLEIVYPIEQHLKELKIEQFGLEKCKEAGVL